MKEKTVLKAVVDRVIAKNITDESYEVLVGRGKDRETEKRKFTIALCPKHLSLCGMQLVKKQTQAVCEICGSAFCSDHLTQVSDGMYYCEEDLPEQYRPKEPEKKGFGFKLPFSR